MYIYIYSYNYISNATKTVGICPIQKLRYSSIFWDKKIEGVTAPLTSLKRTAVLFQPPR